jgi:aspartate racemase
LIGLVGGLGPAATVHYYNELLAVCERRGLRLRLLVAQADVNLALDAAARDARGELAEHLASRMHELERGGASLLAIAAVTPHLCMPELLQTVHVPVVDLVDALNEELRGRRIERVALMGTRRTIESRLFGRLEATVADPTAGQVARCHDLYVSIVQAGRTTDPAAQGLGTLAREFVRDLDVQAVVLAGTELALVPEGMWGGVNVVDCAKLHIEAIVAAAAPGETPVEQP